VSTLRALCLVFALAWAPGAFAALLQYSLSGIDGELERNVRAWLGPEPETPQERMNFVVGARERVENALKALGYYRADIDVDVDRSGSDWSMTIEVTPGPPVLLQSVDIRLQGQAREDSAFTALVDRTPLKQGEVLNHGAYDTFKARLQTLGQERGYFDARFTRSRVAVNVANNTAAVTLDYDSGPRYHFGEVSYDPAQISPELLVQLQPFRVGDYFSQAELQRFQAQLQRTRWFSGVLLHPEVDRARGLEIPISLTLYPAPRHNFDVGVGYSTDTQERLTLTWRTPKINSRGHSQETRLSWSTVNPSGSFVYSIPLDHPLDDVLRLSALVENDKYGDIDSDLKQLRVAREVRSGRWLHTWSLRDMDESWEIKNTKFNNTYLLPGFSLASKTRQGSVVDPEEGFSQLYTVEGGLQDVGSDINLLRVTGLWRYVVTPWPRNRIVTRLELGAAYLADEDRIKLAPSLSFFAGGSQSIRGYGYQSIGDEIEVTRDDGSEQTLVVGGDRLAIASVEYQYYFTDHWRGALFVDGGDAFDAGDFDFKLGPGFGIHYISPVGAVRVEFAYGVDEQDPAWRLHLNIGAEF